MQKLILILILLPAISQAQFRHIKGIVMGSDAKPMAGATISINRQPVTQSDTSGVFTIRIKQRGAVHISIAATGYITTDSTITLFNHDTSVIIIELQAAVRELAQVQVVQQTAVAALKQSMQQVTVIDAKRFYNRSSGAIDILGQASGVRIRQDGGLGSRADFAINGISGKQVKVFIDGIPAAYFGAGAALNTLPVNVIDRLEIYKGVVPVYLGADALGGAINIVTRKQVANYLEATYAISSFNTHRATLNSQHHLHNNIFINTALFYNRSNNNYPIEAEVPNQSGNPVLQKVKRFHDRFSSYYGAAEIGIQNRKWADLASLTLNISGASQQVQHNVVMTQPYGNVTYAEHSLNGYLKYVKNNFLPGLTLSVFAGVGNTKGHFIDTSLNAYAWDGAVVNRRSYGGEISGSRNNLLLNTMNVVSRLTLSYTPDTLTQITFNITGTAFDRKGKDSVAAAFYGKDYYASPTRLFKIVTGLSVERTLPAKKLTSLTTLKYYTYDARGFTINNNALQTASTKLSQWGAGQSFRYLFNTALLARVSYEYATRLPDELEVFGDYGLTKANPALTPEKSHNINLSVQYKRQKFRAEVTGFYRRIDDIIYLKASQFFAQYQNLLKAQITGIEGEVSWQPYSFLQVMANGTWQNIINKSSGANSGTTDDRYYNLRLPNIPYLLSNAAIQFTKPGLFKKGNTLTCWYNTSYVHWFFLYWAIDGRPDQKATIPSQFIQQAGLSYSLRENRYAVSVELQNLADARAYDNFSVQKPGRSVHLKCKVFIQ